MKGWTETRDVLNRLACLGSHEPAALAVLIATEGSSYRRPGARMLVLANGERTGAIGGGCLDEDVALHAREAMRTGESRLLRYDTSGESDAFGVALGCGGIVEILVEPLGDDARSVLRQALNEMRGGREIILTHSLPRASSIAPFGPYWAETLRPSPVLLVFGAGADADALVRLAASVGFRVTLIDHRAALLSAERFGPSVGLEARRPEDELPAFDGVTEVYALVQTHSYELDRSWVEQLIEAQIAYVGVLGPKRRTSAILAELPGDRSNVYAPVGLDIGAEGPEQIAVSVVAELLAVRAGRTPGHLRDRRTAVHAG